MDMTAPCSLHVESNSKLTHFSYPFFIWHLLSILHKQQVQNNYCQKILSKRKLVQSCICVMLSDTAPSSLSILLTFSASIAAGWVHLWRPTGSIHFSCFVETYCIHSFRMFYGVHAVHVHNFIILGMDSSFTQIWEATNTGPWLPHSLDTGVEVSVIQSLLQLMHRDQRIIKVIYS